MGFRDCVVCGEAFAPTRTDAKYCSAVCRQTAYRRRVTDNGGVTDNQQIEAPHVTDAADPGLVMQHSKEDAGMPPVPPPAMTYDEEVAEIRGRKLLPGNERRALNEAKNREMTRQFDAKIREQQRPH